MEKNQLKSNSIINLSSGLIKLVKINNLSLNLKDNDIGVHGMSYLSIGFDKIT